MFLLSRTSFLVHPFLNVYPTRTVLCYKAHSHQSNTSLEVQSQLNDPQTKKSYRCYDYFYQHIKAKSDIKQNLNHLSRLLVDLLQLLAKLNDIRVFVFEFQNALV